MCQPALTEAQIEDCFQNKNLTNLRFQVQKDENTSKSKKYIKSPLRAGLNISCHEL